jgi:nuclear pore complex protein Nup93
LDKNATRIQLGGIPSFTHRLRAFINLVFKTSTEWIDDRLEIIEGLPIWAFIYLLMRTGHLDLAAKFIHDHPEMFATERKFTTYFDEYMAAKDHTVSKATREAILADYNRFEYGEQVVDSYKIIIYKIIGRCELHKKSFPQLIKTTEDYIWLQVCIHLVYL